MQMNSNVVFNNLTHPKVESAEAAVELMDLGMTRKHMEETGKHGIDWLIYQKVVN